jgi:hypothetical protein
MLLQVNELCTFWGQALMTGPSDMKRWGPLVFGGRKPPLLAGFQCLPGLSKSGEVFDKG